MRDRTPSRPMHCTSATSLRIATIQWLTLLAIFALFATVAPAQTQTPAQTPYLFALTPLTPAQDGVYTLLRDPHSGVLQLLPATPTLFKDPCLPEAMDTKGPFLFGVCGPGLAIYTFDGTSGAIQEVATGPWFESTADYGSIVVLESSGHFAYLVKFSDPGPGGIVSYTLDTFLIDRATPQLVPQSTQTLPFGTLMVGMAADPNGLGIILCATQIDQATQASTPMLYTITFDPVSGVATIPTTGTAVQGIKPTSFALSPQGKYFAYGTTSSTAQSGPGVADSYVSLFAMASNQFELAGPPATLTMPATNASTTQPLTMQFDPSGGLLYVQFENVSPPGPGFQFEVYQAPSLTLVNTLILQRVTNLGINDPDGPYVFPQFGGATPQGISVYLIDPSTGIPSQTAALASAFYPSLQLFPWFANYVGAGTGQNETGPFLSPSSTSLNFPQTTAGQSSAVQTLTLKSVGGQSVSINSITSSGANTSEFSLSGSCLPVPLVLAPPSSCLLNVIFSPMNPGTSQATISVVSNSPNNPQTISLSGTAVAPTPNAVLNPANSFTFPGTTTQGTSSAPQNITVSNTGDAPLHITSVSLGSFNAGDYSIGASTCTDAIAPGTTCTIPLTFSPLGSGIRTAAITITDDAANSPQVLTINGNATPAANIAPSSGGSTTASVPAGTPATYNLTATPGLGFNGMISFVCAGVPFAAACSAPSVGVSNGAGAAFTVTITTGGRAALTPVTPSRPELPMGGALNFFLLALVSAILFVSAQGSPKLRHLRPLQVGVVGFVLLGLVISAIGCGTGGGSTQTPPPVKTAAGTYTILVTPTAQATGSSKQLQMSPIQLTLTVN